MTYTELENKVKAKIDDSTTVISEDIYNAIRFLNNFFALEAWSTGLVTVANQNYVSLTNVLDVSICYLDGEEVPELEPADFVKIPKYEENEVQRFYFLDNKLYFTVTPTESNLPVKILKKTRFTLVSGATALDVPTELLQLVELGAISNYYTNLISITAQNRENLPDVSIEEIRRAKKAIDDRFDSLFNLLRNNSLYAL